MTAIAETEAAWRPRENIKARFSRALVNSVLIPNKGPWTVEKLAFAFISGAMAGIDLAEVGERGKVAAGFFDLAMYNNRYLDGFVQRLRHGESSARFLDEFWGIDRKVNAVYESAIEAGYAPEAAVTIKEWFNLNRILNLVSACGFKSNGSLPENFWRQFADKEEVAEISRVVQSCFADWPNDRISFAILFRSLSSAGLAKTLNVLGFGRKLKAEDPYEFGLAERMGAGVMLVQVIDDFWTPSKDIKKSVSGTIAAVIEPRFSKEGCLQIEDEEAKKAIGLARAMIGSCLETAKINSADRPKADIAFWGTLFISAAAASVMARKYGGTHYPLWSTLSSVASEIGQCLRGQNSVYEDFSQKTITALRLATEAVLSY